MDRALKFLEKLELSELEAKLYISLLQAGPVTVRDLSKKTGIGRTTSYPYVDLLVEKGLIAKTVRGSHTYFSANPPEESLKRIIDQKARAISDIQSEFPDVAKTLT